MDDDNSKAWEPRSDTPEETYTAPKREVAWSLVDGSEGRVYIIPSPNLSTFQEKVAVLVKRALRLGVVPPTFTDLRQVPSVVQVDTGEENEWGRPIMEERTIMLHHIAVFHPQVVVSGWEFVAKLEHTEEGNILHTLPGKEVPFQYRDVAAWCDHCQTRRRRNDTFVLHYMGTPDSILWKQVGRNCLTDFLGRDAEKYASAAELYYTLDQVGEASESSGEGGWGGGGPKYEMLDRFLTYVAEVISHVGWKSRSSAHNFGGVSTSNIAQNHLYRRKYDPSVDLFEHPTPQSLTTAQNAIKWAEELTDEEVQDSEYLHNLRVIARRGVVGEKQFGYAASMVSSYQRHIGELAIKARRDAQVSHYVGEVGERRIFHLLVEKVITLETDFGISQLHLMSDDLGNRFTWYAHGVSLDTGKYHHIKATIKAHKMRDGVEQTALSRGEEVLMKHYFVVHQGQTYHFDAADPKDARKVALGVLDIAKLPRGVVIAEAPEPTAPADSSASLPLSE